MPLTTTAMFDDLNRSENRWMRALSGFQKPMRRWILGVAQRIFQAWNPITFGLLSTGSMTFRQEAQWGAMPPQYVRITDGVTVPMWGGVPRIRPGWHHVASVIATGAKILGRHEKVFGNVSGKLRGSGKRVQRSSIVGADTGDMRRSFLSNPVFSADGRAVRLASFLKKAVEFNKRRPFAFLNTTDTRAFVDEMRAWLGDSVRTSFQ